jgi:3-methyladenine DNA glycosylase Mpg
MHKTADNQSVAIAHYLVVDDKACYAFNGKTQTKYMALCGRGAFGALVRVLHKVTCKKCLNLLTQVINEK